jgi:large subunit ribosomal protein L7/L12
MAELTNEEILDAIGAMSLTRLMEFTKQFEERFGVSAQAPVAYVPGAAVPAEAGAVQAAEAEEKTEFTVVIKEVGDKKAPVIKAVRDLTNLDLKSAKELVESAPRPVLEKVSKEEAEKAKELLQAAGATVDIE